MKTTKMMKKWVSGAIVGMMAMVGFTPLPVFAQSKEAVCICEEKCSEDHINEDCEVCIYDYHFCEGAEKPTEESYGPLTPDGNMNLVDDYGSFEAGGKQFITVTTKAGNYFYIIIDRDDNGNETVHFLNLVDESDLLALMEEEEIKAYLESRGMTGSEEKTPEPEKITEEPVQEETKEPIVEELETDEKSSNVTGIMGVILILALGGIGGYVYLKSNKEKKKEDVPDPDADYLEDDDDEDYLTDLYIQDDLASETEEDDSSDAEDETDEEE